MYFSNDSTSSLDLLSKSSTFYSNIYLWSCINQSILTILSRLGFILVQIGMLPRINVNFVILKNTLDICCTTVAYFTLGFVLIFDGDVYSLIYGDRYRSEESSIRKDEFLIGWQAVTIASAIYTTYMVEKAHVISHLLVNVLLAGVIQPLLIRWTWTPEGWIARNSLNGVKVVYRDHAGSAIVHVVGGLAAFIASLILLRKDKAATNNKSRNGGRPNVTSIRTGTVFFGLLLIFAGLQTFSIPISEANVPTAANTVINNLLAACSCFLFVVVLHYILRQSIDHWTTIRCVQALIAGSVMTSAAADKYSSVMSIALGCSGGSIFYLASKLAFSHELEDHGNVVATHLACGLLANVLAPLCIFQMESSTRSVLLNLSWQLISLIIFVGLVSIVLIPILLILDTLGLLRRQSQALNAKEATDIFQMKKVLSDRNINYDRRILTDNPTFEDCKSQEELPKVEELKSPKEEFVNPGKDIKNEKTSYAAQPSGGRIKKLRHLYTLPGCDFLPPPDRFADGDKIDGDLSHNKKHSSETNLRDSKLISNNIESDGINVTNNYRLRRTQKFMNLREELDKQEMDGSRRREESDNSRVDDTYPQIMSFADPNDPMYNAIFK